jgi:hypothetical protein
MEIGEWKREEGPQPVAYLAQIERQIIRRLLKHPTGRPPCHLSQERIARVILPAVTEDRQRAPGLRFGYLCGMALLGGAHLVSRSAPGVHAPRLALTSG